MLAQEAPAFPYVLFQNSTCFADEGYSIRYVTFEFPDSCVSKGISKYYFDA